MATTYSVTIKRNNGTDWDVIHPKTTAENIISGTLDPARIPNLSASKITSGTLGTDRIPDLSASKITSGTFDSARIPSLSASKITSGIFSTDRIPSLDASKITTGTFGADRIPNIDASKITTGTIDINRLPAIAITDVQTSTTMAAFLTIYSGNPSVMQKGDVLILTDDKKTYIHNGGDDGTAADFTLLETPTDVVTSVAGKTGVVTLEKGDVGLSNVPNVDATNPVNIQTGPSYRFVTDTEKSTWSGKVSTLGDLGITVSATKINFLANITQDVQASFDEKQNEIILIQDTLLSGYSGAQSGDVAFTY